MKKPVEMICWFVIAIIWAVIAWIYYSEGRVGFALVQAGISAGFILQAIMRYLKYKKE